MSNGGKQKGGVLCRQEIDTGRYIAPIKSKQKETKERNHENETTSPGNVKRWKITLS